MIAKHYGKVVSIKEGGVFKFAIVIIVLLAGCSRTPDTPLKKLATAQLIVESSPDSALSILDGIDTTTIRSKEHHANFSLLRVKALSKMGIDSTDLSLIKPALDYYPEHGSPEQRMETYFYLGQIYLNRGEDDKALSAFIEGRRDAPVLKDNPILGQLLARQGEIYFYQNKLAKFVDNNLASGEIALQSGDTVAGIRRLGSALEGLTSSGRMKEADSLYDRIIYLCEHADVGRSLRTVVSIPYLLAIRNDSLPGKNLYGISPANITPLTSSDLLALAQGYVKIKEPLKAAEMIHQLKSLHSRRIDSVKYYQILSDIALMMSDYEEAFKMHTEYISALQGRNERLFYSDAAFADDEYDLRTELKGNLNSLKKSTFLLSVGTGMLLILTLVSVWVAYRRERRLISGKTEARKLQDYNLELQECENKLLLHSKNQQEEIADLIRDNNELNSLIPAYEEKLKKEETELSSRHNVLNKLTEEISLKDEQKNSLESAIRYQSINPVKIKPEDEEFLFETMAGVRKRLFPFFSDSTIKNGFADQLTKEFNNPDKLYRTNRLVIGLLCPEFLKKIEERGLSSLEVNYVILLAIGFSYENAAQFLQFANPYKLNTAIRNKLNVSGDSAYLAEIITDMFGEELRSLDSAREQL